MPPSANEGQDSGRRSWVGSANDPECDFPIQNLPFGVFSETLEGPRRIGVAIGDSVLDMALLDKTGLLGPPHGVFNQGSLNAFMALGPAAWTVTRRALTALLDSEDSRMRDHGMLREGALSPLARVHLHLPFEVAGYTDFYASREHATNVGRMFRDPENALPPNWLHLPAGYNGRASTVVVSGTPVQRPQGQTCPPEGDTPIFGPSRKLDLELEVGAVVGLPNAPGAPMTPDQAEDAIFGYVLLNDWSARDIQVWEYQPLGPFLSKAFATTISPWVVTASALAPFRVPGPSQEPPPLPNLRQEEPRNIDIHLEASLRPENGGAATTLARTNFRGMYWSSAQQLAHHASGGCAMRTGDLLGSGTVSGTEPGSLGSLLELTWNGRDPVALDGGGARTFIEDGDTVALRGWCQGEGYRIGFGEASGTVLPARENA